MRQAKDKLAWPATSAPALIGALFAGAAFAGSSLAIADSVFGPEIASGPLDVSVAHNGDTRFFSFDRSSGRLTLGAVNAAGQMTLSQPYGPYDGWTPRVSADGGDGLTRILWTHEDGSASLWLTGPGFQAAFRYDGVPGLTATDVAADTVAGPASDTHILWTGADGSVLLQAIDFSGTIVRSLSFGPYTGWSATAIADGPDGLTRVLWNNTDRRTGVSLVSSEGIVATGRYQSDAGWTALDVAVGGDGLTRILRAHEDGRIALLIVNAVGDVPKYGEVYPAPVGLVLRRIAAAPDGSSRVLFTGFDGSAVLWLMSANGAYESSIVLSLPAGSLAGLWTGTVSESSTDEMVCIPYPEAATASATQTEGSVRFHLTTGGCLGNLEFDGNLAGRQLQGTMTGAAGPCAFAGTATGTGSASQIGLSAVLSSDSCGVVWAEIELKR